MTKHIYILAILLLCCACEAPLDFDRIDSSPCIMANTLIGNAEPSRLYVKIAVPMNSEDRSLEANRVSLNGQVAGKAMTFKDISTDFGQGAYEYTPQISPGEKIRIEASAAGVQGTYAETTVPQPMNLTSARILEREKSFITIEISYEEEEDGHYGIIFHDTDISEAPGILMSESYDMIVSYSTLEREILIWDKHKVEKDGKKRIFKTSLDTGGNKNSYAVSLVSLSPEAFNYLRGCYMKTTNFASIGMSTPAFTYSNVIGGIGTVGSYWETKMTIKMKDQE
jgi:hypothetical protein